MFGAALALGFTGVRLRQRPLNQAGLALGWLSVAIGTWSEAAWYGIITLFLSAWTAWDAFILWRETDGNRKA